MRAKHLTIAIGAMAVALPSVALARVPSMTAGWPAVAPIGKLVPGPDGGVVMIATYGNSENRIATGIAAYAPTLRRLWLTTKFDGCGNCDGGAQPPGLQEDSTYGPLGPTGDDPWAVASDGRVIPVCNGLALPDGTCVFYNPAGASMLAAKGGTVVWEHSRPNLSWGYSFGIEGPAAVFHDRTGVVYTQAHSVPPAPFAQHLVALDEATGTERWTIADTTLLAGLTRGVIAKGPAGVTRIDRDGHVVWARALGGSSGVVTDDAHNRVYVLGTRYGIRALDATTGATVWQTVSGEQARLVGNAANGVVYVAVQGGATPVLRAYTPTGRIAWTWRSPDPVTSVHRLTDGTIAVSTDPRIGIGGLIQRIDPKVPAGRVRTRQFALRRTTINRQCATSDCPFDVRIGFTLKTMLPRAADIRVTLVKPGGPRPPWTTRFRAPEGISYTRLFAGAALPRGVATLEIRAAAAGGTTIRRIPVTVR